MSTLTEREHQVLRCIQDFKARRGKVPSARQITQKLGFKSSRSAQNYIIALTKKGLLQYREPETHAYVLAEDAMRSQSLRVPLVGTIAAGSPAEGFAQSDHLIELPCRFFGNDREPLFALQVMGNSMSGDHICEGDIAIIRKHVQSEPPRDAILAVRVGSDEFTLKRLRFKRQAVELLPSNPQFPVVEVPADHVTILGIYVGLLRRS